MGTVMVRLCVGLSQCMGVLTCSETVEGETKSDVSSATHVRMIP